MASSLPQQQTLSTQDKTIIGVDFEVFGKVQGVFFRKYTQQEAKKLNIFGWVMNTTSGTVTGQLQGEPISVNRMKQWLKTKGSPKSKIEKCEFKTIDTKHLNVLQSFEIRK
jgi:acylphosphatase